MSADPVAGVATFPREIVLMGGGRWARVVLDVLCGLVPSDIALRVVSPTNAEGMMAWTSARADAARLDVRASYTPSAGAAVIVCNAARDHEATADRVLRAGCATLVEKPVALSADGAERLADIARARAVPLAASHIFVFARYFELFAARVAASGPVESLTVHWADPLSERRYGEAKRYDPSLPVFADWIPHVVPIARQLLSSPPVTCRRLAVGKGGARVELELSALDARCAVHLERNGGARTRVVDVRAGGRALQLDFSAEKAVIRDGDEIVEVEPPADLCHRPLARMLTAFLRQAGGGAADPRLSFGAAADACRLSDAIATRYREALASWLAGRAATGSAYDEDVRYALAEHGRDSVSELLRTLEA